MPRADLPPGLLPLPDNVRLQLLPAADAVAAFQARGQLTQTFAWQELWQEEHARQFTVAKLFRNDLLAEIHKQLGRALTEGKTLKDFKDALIPQLKQAGWWGTPEVIDPRTGEIARTRVNPARLELIYDINLRQSHAAGRWARSERGAMPYLIYRTRRDERVRASHQRWDAIVLPKNHPWWDTHYPPNGWRCRCLAYPIDEAGLQQLEAAGIKIRRQPPDDGPAIPFLNKQTGEISQVPWGIDPGFAYNPGKAAAEALRSVSAQKLNGYPPTIATAAVREQVAGAEFSKWFSQPVGDFPIAVIAREDAARIGSTEQVAIFSEATHAKQIAQHPELSIGDYQRVQEVIARGTSYQDSAVSLVYVLDQADGMTSVVKATLSGKALFMTSLRYLPTDPSQRAAEIRRILRKASEYENSGK